MLRFSKQNNTLTMQSDQEWLETNSLGSYASSTLLDYPTRKYHGLLVARLLNPYGKFVLLSRFEEHFSDGFQKYPLSLQHYANYFDTQAFASIDSFTLDLHPCISYRCGSTILTKEILFVRHKNIVLIKYRVDKTAPNIKIFLRPLLAYRSLHELMRANSFINTKSILKKNGVIFSPYTGMPSLYICSKGDWQFTEQPCWYYSFSYPEEEARGYASTEDLFAPGVIELSFSDKQEIIIACSLEEITANDLENLWQTELTRRGLDTKQLPDVNTSFIEYQLKKRAVNQVILEPEPGAYSIIAGYHWFTQWGRDAMISLPGLTLSSGNENICLQILRHFAAHEKRGLIPNRIAPTQNEENDYDSMDSSLWFCWAVQQYYFATKNLDTIKQHLWTTIKNIIFYYRQGTDYAIKQANNGLIYGGNSAIKLTWMDVMINGVALTPRHGAAVEINALWYNALCFAAELSNLFLEKEFFSELTMLITLVKKSFTEVFWNTQKNYLYDFVNDVEKNDQLRPNQIIAVALPYCALETTMACAVIQTVQKNLLTPYGLRSLATQDAQYQGTYMGDQQHRDQAYHNGTVWPWLLGSFAEALVKFFSKAYAQSVLQPCLTALSQHINQEAGILCVSEIFDGDAPHKPRGCIQQAWSIAEIIRMVRLLK